MNIVNMPLFITGLFLAFLGLIALCMTLWIAMADLRYRLRARKIDRFVNKEK